MSVYDIDPDTGLTRERMAGDNLPEPRVFCTVKGHKDGQHSKACVPAADPNDAHLRLFRAIIGLCPICDNPEEHEHEEEAIEEERDVGAKTQEQD